MKKIFTVLLMLGISLFAYSAEVSYKALTGDLSLDTTLGTLNIEAKADLSDFEASISFSYGVPEENVTKLLVEEKMEPADVYMIFELAAIQNTPVDNVVTVYKKNKGKGWGVISQDMGIKPGSDAFKAIKENTGKTKKVKKNKSKDNDKNENKNDKGKNK